MAAENERDYVAGLYPGRKWKQKVKKMPEAQMLAIYLRAKAEEQKTKPKESPPDAEPF